jgi:hypothetical protein
VHRGEDETHGFEGGFGNFFARQMQIHRWHAEQVCGAGATDDCDDE